MKVIGAIDSVAINSVSGWLTAPGVAEPRFVRVFADNVEQGTVRADNFRQDLKESKISNGFSGYKFTFSKPLDPLCDHVIRIEDRDIGNCSGKTEINLKGLLSTKSERVETFFGFDRDFVAVNVRYISYNNGIININVEVNGSDAILMQPKVTNAEVEVAGIDDLDSVYLKALKIPAKSY